MDPTLLRQLEAAVRRSGLSLGEDFSRRLDQYTNQHFSGSRSADQRTIHIFLANAAFNIAKTENKSTVDADDVKAAIWMFHLPEQPTDPCRVAGQTILEMRTRIPFRRQLSAPFRTILENYEGHGTTSEAGY